MRATTRTTRTTRTATWAGPLAAALLALTTAGGPATATPATPIGHATAQRAPSTNGMDVWNWNITGAGTNNNNPSDIDNGGAPRAVRPIVDGINAGARPDVITLQEVCATQKRYLKPKLEAVGYTVHWRAVRTQNRCADYKNYAKKIPRGLGDLVAVPTGYGPTAYDYDFDLNTPSPTGEGLTCLGFTKTRFTVACSTQISGTEAQRLAKTYRMRKDEIEPWVSYGYGVIIAGDFNTKPGQEPMKHLYRDRDGQLVEADKAQNRWTQQNRTAPYAKRKIDYVFFNPDGFPAPSLVADLTTRRNYSYHRFYAASATVR